MMERNDPTVRASGSVLASDTSPEAQRVQVDLWRRMSPLEKARTVTDTTRAVQKLCLLGIRRRHRGASDLECRLRLAVLTLGRTLAQRVYPEVSSLSDR